MLEGPGVGCCSTAADTDVDARGIREEEVDACSAGNDEDSPAGREEDCDMVGEREIVRAANENRGS